MAYKFYIPLRNHFPPNPSLPLQPVASLPFPKGPCIVLSQAFATEVFSASAPWLSPSLHLDFQLHAAC